MDAVTFRNLNGRALEPSKWVQFCAAGNLHSTYPILSHRLNVTILVFEHASQDAFHPRKAAVFFLFSS